MYLVMEPIRYSDINLTNIKSLLIDSLREEDDHVDIFIPSTFPINQSLLYDFNRRIFKPSNINEILSLCDYLMIEDTNNFILLNMEPSNMEYILSDRHKDHYKIPRYPYSAFTINEIAQHGLIKYMIKKYEHVHGPDTIYNYTSVNGQLECLKYGWLNNFEWSDVTYKWICCKGHIECLKWMREKEYPWHEYTCTMCGTNGQLECLKYAVENGCAMKDMICYDIIEQGHFECLQYVVNKGCHKILGMCTVVADRGNLKVLKFLHENGFPWYKQTLIDNNCPE
jgi:hypothetical protein